MPDGYGGDGGGGRGGGVDSFVPTSVRSTPMSRGGRRAAAIATLPSPILAAASLPPASLSGRRRRRRAEEEEAATCRGTRVVPGLRGSAHEAVRRRVRALRLPPSGIDRGVGGHVLGDVVRGERRRRRPAGAVVVFLVDGVRARSAQACAVKAVPGKAAWATFCCRQATARRWRWSISK
jgi:hypothetical protein